MLDKYIDKEIRVRKASFPYMRQFIGRIGRIVGKTGIYWRVRFGDGVEYHFLNDEIEIELI